MHCCWPNGVPRSSSPTSVALSRAAALRPSPPKRWCPEIRAAGGEAIACHASVADEDGAASIVQTALDAFGRIDVVVNNAGIAAPDWFEDTPMERFRRMVEVHYLGTVYVTHAAWPHMVEAGYGRIVNTCSEANLGFVPKSAAYAGAKGAVLGFTRALALEAPRHGIRVNAVAPRAQTRLSGPEVMAKTYDVPVEMFERGGTLDQYARTSSPPPRSSSPTSPVTSTARC